MHFWRPALAAALGGLALNLPTAAYASCGLAGPAPTLTAELGAIHVAFVGTVVYTRDNNRFARVRVESIWKGPRLPAFVDVHGEAPGSGPFSGSEGDHMYQTGKTYLFLPLNDHPPFQDYGDCSSSTEIYTTDVAAVAPPDARLPDAPTPVDSAANLFAEYSTAGAIAGLAFALVVVGFVVRRRRTRG
jgi:hypothetical protein